MKNLIVMILFLVPMISVAQQPVATTYRQVYLDRLGKTVTTTKVGGYLFEEIYDQPRTPGQPYYPVLRVTKDGSVVRLITPDDIPIEDADCTGGGTCAEIRADDPTYEYRNGPCFGKAIFDGPSFLAYAPEGNYFYFYVSTDSPAVMDDLEFIVYYADLDSDKLFRIGKCTAMELKNGSVSPIDENYIVYRADYAKGRNIVGCPLRVMKIYDGREKIFPEALKLPTDTFLYYSVHSYKWVDSDRIQLELYAYKSFPGEEETLKDATVLSVTYDMSTAIASQAMNVMPRRLKKPSKLAKPFKK